MEAAASRHDAGVRERPLDLAEVDVVEAEEQQRLGVLDLKGAVYGLGQRSGGGRRGSLAALR